MFLYLLIEVYEKMDFNITIIFKHFMLKSIILVIDMDWEMVDIMG